MKTTLTVQGMMCANCEKRVVQACMALSGMMHSEASAADHKVVCEFDETKTNIDQIKATIEDIGYDVTDVK